MLLLAEHILDLDDAALRHFVDHMQVDVPTRQDLATMLVSLIVDSSAASTWIESVKRLVAAMASIRFNGSDFSALCRDGPRLAAAVALRAVDRDLGAGSEHRDRAKLLQRLCGGEMLTGLTFSRAVGRYDFRGIRFDGCRFEEVTWVNCTFDATTEFSRCQFMGGAIGAHTQGLGSAVVSNSSLDEEASAWVSNVRILEERKRYNEDDLRNDINSVLKKFIVRGGLGLRTVHEKDLLKGSIGSSRFKEAVVDALSRTVLETHPVSGTSGLGYNVRDSAVEAVQFFAVNNVMTGPLREAFDRLKRLT